MPPPSDPQCTVRTQLAGLQASCGVGLWPATPASLPAFIQRRNQRPPQWTPPQPGGRKNLAHGASHGNRSSTREPLKGAEDSCRCPQRHPRGTLGGAADSTKPSQNLPNAVADTLVMLPEVPLPQLRIESIGVEIKYALDQVVKEVEN